jgi:hypothetical protein
MRTEPMDHCSVAITVVNGTGGKGADRRPN